MDIKFALENVSAQDLLTLGENNKLLSNKEKDEILAALEDGWVWGGNSLSQLIYLHLFGGDLPKINDFDLFRSNPELKVTWEDSYGDHHESPNLNQIGDPSNTPINLSCKERISYAEFFSLDGYGIFAQENPFNWTAAYMTASGLVWDKKFTDFLNSGEVKLTSRYVRGGKMADEKAIKRLVKKASQGFNLHNFLNFFTLSEEELSFLVQEDVVCYTHFRHSGGDFMVSNITTWAEIAQVVDISQSCFSSEEGGFLVTIQKIDRFTKWIFLHINEIRKEFLNISDAETLKVLYYMYRECFSDVSLHWWVWVEFNSLFIPWSKQTIGEEILDLYRVLDFSTLAEILIKGIESDPIQLQLKPYHTDVVTELGIQLDLNVYYLGIEVETRYHQETSRSNRLKQEIIKCEKAREGLPTRDGTVDAEFVTVPFQPEELKQWVDRRKGLFKSLKVDQEVGMHMHVSRTAFSSQLAEALFVVFVNYAVLDNRFEWLFGPQSTWAKAKNKSVNDYVNFDRKEAVNCQNISTIEVRAFRGTTNPELVKQRVCFIQNAIQFCNEQAQQQTLNPPFEDFVECVK